MKFLAVKTLSALLHKKSSKHGGYFYCMDYLTSFRTVNKLKSHEKVCQKKGFCGIVMPTEKNEILKFHEYMKSQIIYAIHYLY